MPARGRYGGDWTQAPCYIDTAESYGTEGTVREAIAELGNLVFVATKVSPQNFRAEDLKKSVDGSLNRLGVERIDLLQLHEPNSSIPIEETMGTLANLIDDGKIRYVGVSNFSLTQLQDAQNAFGKNRIVSNQVRYNLIDRTIEKGLMQHCQTNGITVIAYCPLARGLNRLRDCDPTGIIDELAEQLGKSPAQVVLNWALCHDGVVVIPKGNTEEHILDNCGASDWRLNAEHLHLLDPRIRFRHRTGFDNLIRQAMPRGLQNYAKRALNYLPAACVAGFSRSQRGRAYFMCGIAGILTLSGKRFEPDLPERMIHTIRHRGPDGTGFHSDQHAGLGHARLSIIDIAGGRQPMQLAERSIWITFNGEIFNYIELREELISKGHHFASRSDTEVILHMYQEYGEKCVELLNGQWSFAIWDAPRRKLFLSRDRMGVRPLFYTQTPDHFLFASEIKALFACPEIPRELDLEGLDEIFTFWTTLPSHTAFRNIRQLPPGHSMAVENGQVRVSQYWKLSLAPEDDRSDGREQSLTDELLSLLLDATKIRLRSDVPVGAYLSGGIDSTLITALAKQAVGDRLRTFSVRFDDAEFDESLFQSEASEFLETQHSFVNCTQADIAAQFPDVIRHTEQPILRTAPAPLFALSGLVRNSGYKVVLTGEGADEVMGGYDIFKEAKIRPILGSTTRVKVAPASSQAPLSLHGCNPTPIPGLPEKLFPRDSGNSCKPILFAPATLEAYIEIEDVLFGRSPSKNQDRTTHWGRWKGSCQKVSETSITLIRQSFLNSTFCYPDISCRRRATVWQWRIRWRAVTRFSITVSWSSARNYRLA